MNGLRNFHIDAAMHLPRRTAICLLVAALLGGCASAPTAATATREAVLRDRGVSYWLEVRTEPRPLRLHHVKIDLANPRIELAAALADDPDGPGPASAALTPPDVLAERSRAIVLVNANPWRSLPDANGKRSTDWREGMPVEAMGLSASGGAARTQEREGHCAFWLDRARRPHVGRPAAEVSEGVAGFLQLLRDGRPLQEPGGPIHPRTALGLDASGRWLHLVVVDGRQAGYSEGMALRELADVMLARGCRDAANLDGGGSSILIMSGPDGRRAVINDPSTKKNGRSVPRPIPVALVVRER